MSVSALCFLAGITLVQQLPTLPNGAILLAGLLLAGILARLRYYRGVLFLIGVLWASVFAHHRLSDRLPEALEGKDIRIQGHLSGLPDINEQGVRFDFVVEPAQTVLPDKIRLSWHHPETVVKAGQHWIFSVRLKRPHGTVNPGGFDYERWLLSRGIGGTGYVRSDPKPELLKATPAWYRIDAWRQGIADTLSLLLADNHNQGLIKALTIGDGSGISQQQWRLFRETGTTHLVVISGSHIGLVSGFIYLLVLKFWSRTGNLRWPPPRIAAVSAMAVAALYSALAGFSVPTQRSVIMLTMVMASVILQRNSRPTHTLAVALVAVLVFDPLAVLSPGFWLSFLAVSLIAFAMAGRLRKTGYVFASIKLHWFAAIGLSPVLLLYFQQISLIAPLANLAAVPVISLLVVPLSLLAVAAMWLAPDPAAGMFYLAGRILDALIWLLTMMADLPSAAMIHPSPPFWALLFAIPGVLLLLSPFGTPARGLSLMLLLPLFTTPSTRLHPGEIRVTLLDVGQGLSATVQTENHWLVYDTGARYSEDSDMGQNVVLPYLHSQSAPGIDRLIVSHGDNDHIGGTPSLIEGITVGNILTSVPESLDAYKPIHCVAGQMWQWDQVRFKMLSPMRHWKGSDNNNSCVLKIESDHGAILLPGDIESGTESWLVQTYGQDLQADVLIAPHHGSKTSSTAEFLEAVQPAYVLIPSGYRSPFGHPHRDVLERYRHFKIPWLTSADSGAIEVSIKNHSFQVSGLRQTKPRYWRMHSIVSIKPQ